LSFDHHSFNFGTDVEDIDTKAGVYIDEIRTDLSFRNSGGKILVTQGWGDPLNAAIWPIQHLRDLEAFFNGDISDLFNLFMISGAGHCGASGACPDVPATYHTVEKVIQWVERGEKPDYTMC
jgi:feruloyl esterase